MPNTPAAQIVWIDCEMTGLNPEIDGLCEIAVIVTDFDLQPLDPGFSVVINPGEAALLQMNDFVRGMHERSGLLPLINAGVTPAAASEQVIAYVDRFVDKAHKPLVAGNTIGMDRSFISRHLPELDARLHYRSIDVSTIKELSRRWFTNAYYQAPKKLGEHRALVDIAESIRELAYFRSAVFLGDKGPNSASAKKLSAQASVHYADLLGAEPA